MNPPGTLLPQRPSGQTQTRVLAVETSSRHGSIALGDGPTPLVCRPFDQTRPRRDHAADMLPTLDAAMRQADWRPSDIDHVYVSAGPGSFTGLRIAVTFAKTLAFATGCRIVMVPTVDVLAANAPADTNNLGIVLDAKRGQVFAAVYARPGPGLPLRPIREVAMMTPAEMLAASPRPLHLLGEGIDYHRDALSVGPDVVELPRALWWPRAEAVLSVGWSMASAGQFTLLHQAAPIYLRRPEAVDLWEKRHGPG